MDIYLRASVHVSVWEAGLVWDVYWENKMEMLQLIAPICWMYCTVLYRLGHSPRVRKCVWNVSGLVTIHITYQSHRGTLITLKNVDTGRQINLYTRKSKISAGYHNHTWHVPSSNSHGQCKRTSQSKPRDINPAFYHT